MFFKTYSRETRSNWIEHPAGDVETPGQLLFPLRNGIVVKENGILALYDNSCELDQQNPKQ